MKKLVAGAIALALLGQPVSAAAEAFCPMTASKIASSSVAVFSASAPSCCPEGQCDCTIQAPSPFQAALPQDFSFARPDSSPSFVSDAGTPPDAFSAKIDRSESPPKTDKPYKLTAQYRI